jgi:hypothetical protein
MKVGAVVSDLLLYSRIEAAARSAGADLVRVDDPHELPVELDLVLVDWSARQPGWAEALGGRGGRVILFGPHVDLDAHADARASGLGPMMARSKLVADLGPLMDGSRSPGRQRSPGP